MENEPSPHATALLARQTLETQLRNAYPYLKTEALKTLLNKTSTLIECEISNQIPVMARTRTRINFFSLSAELRNRIYEHALGIDPKKPVEVRIQEAYANVKPRVKKLLTPKLLQVSRKIRSEAGSIFYGNILFCATFKSYTKLSRSGDEFLNQTEARDYLHLIGTKQAGMIRHLRLRFMGDSLFRLEHLINVENSRDAFTTPQVSKRLTIKALGFVDEGLRDEIVESGLSLEFGGEPPHFDSPWRSIEEAIEARDGMA